MTQQKVYVVRTFGENDAEPFNELLGIFANLSDAKTVMAQDIEQIKKDWNQIDFNDPNDWVVDESELSYEGFTPSDDYQYAVVITEMPIQ